MFILGSASFSKPTTCLETARAFLSSMSTLSRRDSAHVELPRPRTMQPPHHLHQTLLLLTDVPCRPQCNEHGGWPGSGCMLFYGSSESFYPIPPLRQNKAIIPITRRNVGCQTPCPIMNLIIFPQLYHHSESSPSTGVCTTGRLGSEPMIAWEH
ncbi:hypothetical protein VTI74DRAFT_5055 [Chaetomium olivicolor]